MSEQPSIDKFGKAFWYITWIIVLFFLYFLFQSILEHRANPNSQPQSYGNEAMNEVVLKINAYGSYIAGGTINNEQATFIVDTGASSVSVPEHLATLYGLEKGRQITTVTANGYGTAYLTEIRELSIGNITLYNIKANITPGIKEDAVLLGMSALKKLEFSQRGNTLTLRKYH